VLPIPGLGMNLNCLSIFLFFEKLQLLSCTVIVAGTSSDEVASAEKNEVVVVDARNVYETRIGKFNVPNVETLDPEIRQYSDLPSWIDEHTEKLRGKSILMYILLDL